MRFFAPHPHDLDTALEELARVEPSRDERALLVVYPKSACSSSASAVVVDGGGRFVGAVAPGTAALLNVPAAAPQLMLFPSVEVTAPVGTWHGAQRVGVPPLPSGLLVRAKRLTGRECDLASYFDVIAASKAEIEDELSESAVTWLAPVPSDGQAWLDAHRTRIDELLTTPPSRPPGDISHILIR